MEDMRRTSAAVILILLTVGFASAATVDGINLQWTSAGTGTQTLVFVHGWTCDETSWQGQVPAISQKYRVITLDLPGHGKSGSPKDGKFSMALFARAVEAVRSEAKVEKAVFAGHSMGTPVVRQYALMYPQRVAGLVLVDGLVLVAGSTKPFPVASMTGPEGLKAREGFIRGMFSTATTPQLQKQILQMMLGAKEATAAGAFQATWDPSWWTNDVISAPTLGLYADKSGLADRAGMNRLYSKLEYHEIPGTGHFLMMEKPQEFNKLLTDFLANVKF
jgi:pimeloyl-ACP methyl ester carboxylesterase